MENSFKRILQFVTIISWMSIALWSCSEDNINKEVEETASDQLSFVREKTKYIEFLNSLGWSTDSIKLFSDDSVLVVEGDIRFSFEALNFWMKEANLDSRVSRVEQRSWYIKLANNYYHSVGLYYDSSLPGIWQEAMDEALMNWNKVEYVAINFYRTYSRSNAKIIVYGTRIGNEEESRKTNGYANYPTDRYKPGSSISFNLNNTHPKPERVNIAMHELGHTIALAHTNDYQCCGYEHIPGTPSEDIESIMHSPRVGAGIQRSDVHAVQRLYPYPYSTPSYEDMVVSPGNTSYFAPKNGEISLSRKDFEVRWRASRINVVPKLGYLDLYQNQIFVKRIATLTKNQLYYPIYKTDLSNVSAGEGYKIKLTYVKKYNNQHVTDWSDFAFRLY